MSRERLRAIREELQLLVKQGPPSEYEFGQPLVCDVASASFASFPREAEYRKAYAEYWQRREEFATEAAGLVELAKLDAKPIFKLADESIWMEADATAEIWSLLRQAEMRLGQRPQGSKKSRERDIDDELVERWGRFRATCDELPSPAELAIDARKGSFAHFTAWAVDEFEDMPSDDPKNIERRIRARRKRPKRGT